MRTGPSEWLRTLDEALTTDRQHPDYDAFWFEERMRWTGHYVLLCADGEDTPAEIGFWGDSGD